MSNKTIFLNSIYCAITLIVMISCSSSEKEEISAYEKLQRQTINFIAQPAFSGDYIFYKITSAKANLEMYYYDIQQVYFTCNKQDYVPENLNKFIINMDCVVVAQLKNDRLEIDTKIYSDTSKVFFKMPVSNFKVDSNRVIETKYDDVTYKVTLSQIFNFSNLKSAIGGGAIAISEDNHHFMNHGSVVAKQNEASLNDFVKQVTKNTITKEAKAQVLLNFVTRKIEYNQDEASNGYETIKRPDEVLFTKNSDCSGKAILYASLLQQLDVKWSLFYFENHICVGVAGKFNEVNPHKFKLNGTDYYLAEITDPNAIIGVDSWDGKMNEDNLEYYQLSDSSSNMYSYKTNRKLEFVRGSN
ncbi:MAG: transglutaminase-like domain-containing protein [Bacteroidia bacterium]